MTEYPDLDDLLEIADAAVGKMRSPAATLMTGVVLQFSPAPGGGSAGSGFGDSTGDGFAGGGACVGVQSGMKIQTDDHFAVILLHAAGFAASA